MARTGKIEKYTNAYADPSGSTYSPMKHRRDLNGSPFLGAANSIQIKPKLIETGLYKSPSFQKLSPSF
jgi:hypothetical protein